MPFWPFSRNRKTTPLTAVEIQAKLVEVATKKSLGDLYRFCRDYQDQIVSHASELNHLPEEVRENPQEAQRFIQGLGTAAQCMAEKLTEPDWSTLTSRMWKAGYYVPWPEYFRSNRKSDSV